MTGSAWRIPWPDRFGAFWQQTWPRLGPRLADLESRFAAESCDLGRVDRPVFICGLARSGSTMLLEWLSAMPGFTAHHYSDFPLLWTPFWWNTLLARLPRSNALPVERAHRDRIMVTRDSPEAFEEVLWQQFFPHDPRAPTDVLDARFASPEFLKLHRAHIAKLVHARAARRYVSKGNYNTLRIGWLARHYPDAHFLIPLREPLDHVASLLRQDALYAHAPEATLRHIAARGHHEFGALKRIMRVDGTSTAAIAHDRAAGRLAQAWLRQWLAVYGLASALCSRGALDTAQLTWVPFESICAQPLPQLTAIARRLAIDADSANQAALSAWSQRFSAPAHAPENLEAQVDPALLDEARALYALHAHGTGSQTQAPQNSLHRNAE